MDATLIALTGLHVGLLEMAGESDGVSMGLTKILGTSVGLGVGLLEALVSLMAQAWACLRGSSVHGMQ